MLFSSLFVDRVIHWCCQNALGNVCNYKEMWGQCCWDLTTNVVIVYFWCAVKLHGERSAVVATF